MITGRKLMSNLDIAVGQQRHKAGFSCASNTHYCNDNVVFAELVHLGDARICHDERRAGVGLRLSVTTRIVNAV